LLLAVLACAVVPTARALGAKPVEATLTLEVDAHGVNATPVRTYLRVEAPADRPGVAGVLANEPGSGPYRTALDRLLLSLGLFGETGVPFPTLVAIHADAPPDVSIANGRATLLFGGTEDLGSYVGSGVPGLWDISRSGSRARFCLDQDAPLRADVDWTLEAYVDGSKVLSATPRPSEWLRVASFPPAPHAQSEAPTPARASGGGGIEHLVWHPSAGAKPATVPQCVATAVGRGGVHGYAFETKLAPRTHVLLASYVGRWAHLRLALAYVVAGLVLLPLVYLLLTGVSGPLGAVRERAWAWAALAGSLVLVAGGVAMWLVELDSTSVSTAQVRPPLVAGATALGVALVPHRRAARPAVAWLALVALAVAAALWAQDRAGRSAFFSGRWLALGEGVSAALAVAVLSLAALALLAAAAAGRGRVQRAGWIAAVVAAASALLVFQSAAAMHRTWAARHDVAQALAPSLVTSGWHSWAAGALVYFPTTFVGLVVDLLPVVGFAASLALLAADGAGAPTMLFPRGRRRELVALVLVFSAFAIGTQGSFYGWSLPLAFVFGLALWPLVRQRTIDRVVEDVDRLNPELPQPVAVRSRDALLRRATAREGRYVGGPRLPHGVSPAALALALGPGETWWENGRVALRIGARLSLAPLAFYTYVLATTRLGHDLSLGSDGGVADLLRSTAHEVVFWLALAFVLGALFPYLPTATGIGKGLAVGLVYTAATGLAMWLQPGGGDWIFRGLEVVLFLVVLGILLDRETLVVHGKSWRFLIGYYRVGELRFSLAYASAALGALLAIVQQLHSGDAQGAITQIIKSLPAFVPPVQ
jgi:hypothetical protein